MNWAITTEYKTVTDIHFEITVCILDLADSHCKRAQLPVTHYVRAWHNSYTVFQKGKFGTCIDSSSLQVDAIFILQYHSFERQ